MDNLHVYTRSHQPATRFEVVIGGLRSKGHWFTLRRHARVWTSCCRRRRIAGNCTTQVYYDSQPFWCRPGKGCKRKRVFRRVTARRLVREFQAGLSFVGLARKYGMPTLRVGARIRAYLNAARRRAA